MQLLLANMLVRGAEQKALLRALSPARRSFTADKARASQRLDGSNVRSRTTNIDERYPR